MASETNSVSDENRERAKIWAYLAQLGWVLIYHEFRLFSYQRTWFEMMTSHSGRKPLDARVHR